MLSCVGTLLSYTGGSDKGLFQTAAASRVTVKGVGVSAFTMPGPMADQHGTRGVEENKREIQKNHYQKREKNSNVKCKKIAPLSGTQRDNHVRRMQQRDKKGAVVSFGPGFSSNSVAQDMQDIDELRLD